MSSGILYIVSTPIGNLGDLSPRAVEILSNVKLILCENTAHSIPFLSSFSISKPVKSYHNYNERDMLNDMIDFLKDGNDVALISDAGTPLISDPGYHITKACHANKIKVSPVPGCCALVAALSASGMPTDNFKFCGFVPSKVSHRIKEYSNLIENDCTYIYYESSHRILESVKDLISIIGHDRQICLAKEITKHFEKIVTGNAKTVLDFLIEDVAHQKGEFVLMISKANIQKSVITEPIKLLIRSLISHLPPKVLTKSICTSFDLDKDEVYKYILELKSV